jgi:hypothetical protein
MGFCQQTRVMDKIVAWRVRIQGLSNPLSFRMVGPHKSNPSFESHRVGVKILGLESL